MSAVKPIVLAEDGQPIRSADWMAMQSGLRGAITTHDHRRRPLDPACLAAEPELRLRAVETGTALVGGVDLAGVVAGALGRSGGEVSGDLAVSGDVRVRGACHLTAGATAPAPDATILSYPDQLCGYTNSRLSGTDSNLNHEGLWTLCAYQSITLESTTLLALLSVGSLNLPHQATVLQHAVGVEEVVIPLHAFRDIRPGTRAELLSWARSEAIHPETGWRPILDAGRGLFLYDDSRSFELLQWVELPPGQYRVGLAAFGRGGPVDLCHFSLSFL